MFQIDMSNFQIIDCKRRDLDFTSQKKVDNWFKKHKPDIVINAAGRVGGIWDNYNFQSDYLYINTMIGMNIINSSFKYNVKQLIYTNNLKTTESQYLDIISDKTAQLFSAACKISAEICEIDEEKKDFLSDFGKFIGIAYQIVDDTLDYFCKSNDLSMFIKFSPP